MTEWKLLLMDTNVAVKESLFDGCVRPCKLEASHIWCGAAALSRSAQFRRRHGIRQPRGKWCSCCAKEARADVTYRHA